MALILTTEDTEYTEKVVNISVYSVSSVVKKQNRMRSLPYRLSRRNCRNWAQASPAGPPAWMVAMSATKAWPTPG